MEDTSIMDDISKNRIKAADKIKELDAELNGGLLVEVAKVMGKPIYMRINQHDPDRAKWELDEMRSVIKDVVVGFGD